MESPTIAREFSQWFSPYYTSEVRTLSPESSPTPSPSTNHQYNRQEEEEEKEKQKEDYPNKSFVKSEVAAVSHPSTIEAHSIANSSHHQLHQQQQLEVEPINPTISNEITQVDLAAQRHSRNVRRKRRGTARRNNPHPAKRARKVTSRKRKQNRKTPRRVRRRR